MSRRQRKTVNRFGVTIETNAHWPQPTPEQFMRAASAFYEAMKPHRNSLSFTMQFYTGTTSTRRRADEFDAGFNRLGPRRSGAGGTAGGER